MSVTCSEVCLSLDLQLSRKHNICEYGPEVGGFDGILSIFLAACNILNLNERVGLGSLKIPSVGKFFEINFFFGWFGVFFV